MQRLEDYFAEVFSGLPQNKKLKYHTVKKVLWRISNEANHEI